MRCAHYYADTQTCEFYEQLVNNSIRTNEIHVEESKAEKILHIHNIIL